MLALCLLKNIDKLKKSKIQVKKKWLNTNLLLMDFDNVEELGGTGVIATNGNTPKV